MHPMKMFIFLTLNSFKSNYAHKMWPTWTRLDQQVWRKRINAVIYSATSTIKAVPLMWHASKPSSTWYELEKVFYNNEDGDVVTGWEHGLHSSNPHYGLDYYKVFLVCDCYGKDKGQFPCPWAWDIGLGFETPVYDSKRI